MTDFLVSRNGDEITLNAHDLIKLAKYFDECPDAPIYTTSWAASVLRENRHTVEIKDEKVRG